MCEALALRVAALHFLPLRPARGEPAAPGSAATRQGHRPLTRRVAHVRRVLVPVPVQDEAVALVVG